GRQPVPGPAPRQRKNEGNPPNPQKKTGAGPRVLPPQPREAEDDNEYGQPPGDVLQPGQEGTFDLVLQHREESARAADQIVEELRHGTACRLGWRGGRRGTGRLSEGGEAQATDDGGGGAVGCG